VEECFIGARARGGSRSVFVSTAAASRNGRFLREWKLGHPFSLFVTPNHFINVADAIASRILKIDQAGKVVGVLSGPEPGKGPHFDPHEIAVGKDNSILRRK
jgi:hypothetical protein